MCSRGYAAATMCPGQTGEEGFAAGTLVPGLTGVYCCDHDSRADRGGLAAATMAPRQRQRGHVASKMSLGQPMMSYAAVAILRGLTGAP